MYLKIELIRQIEVFLARLPETVACRHHPLFALLGVSSASLCIFVRQEAEKFGLSPQAGKVAAAFGDADRTELHAIDVDNGEVPLTVHLVEENVTR